MKKILLLGAQGMLGMELFEELQNDLEVIPFSRFNLNLTNIDGIIPAIKKVQPDIVINAAAFTGTQKAEKRENQKTVTLINEIAPGEIAKACKEIGALFVHFSTDFVFDGKDKSGFKEDDKKNPINFYGLSKSNGEDGIIANCDNYLIIRTAWLFGEYGPNFIKNFLQLGKAKREVQIANDIFVSATYAKDLAKSVHEILLDEDAKSGIYHLVNEGEYSLYEIAKMAYEIKGITTPLLPVSHVQFDDGVPRPLHAVLLNTKYKPLRRLDEAIREYLQVKS